MATFQRANSVYQEALSASVFQLVQGCNPIVFVSGLPLSLRLCSCEVGSGVHGAREWALSSRDQVLHQGQCQNQGNLRLLLLQSNRHPSRHD